MPTTKEVGNKRSDTVDEQSNKFASIYYQHQYDRISKHEDHRLSVSNIILTLSILVLGFTGTQSPNFLTGVSLPIIIIGINIFTVLSFVRTYEYQGVHKKRAKRILELYANNIFKIDQDIHVHEGFLSKYWNDWTIQIYIHIFLALIALFPLLVFLKIIP
jgi:hypothetical protein